MSTETQKVDVLAVMDRLHQYLLLASNEEAQRRMHPMANSMTARAGNLIEDTKEVRAAVAELIKQRDEAVSLLREHAEALLYEPDEYSLDARIDAFLARVGGDK